VPTIIWHLLGVTTVDVILTSELDSYSNSEFSDLDYPRPDQVPTIIGHYYEFIKSMFFLPQMQTNTQPIFFHMTLLTVEGIKTNERGELETCAMITVVGLMRKDERIKVIIFPYALRI